MIKYICFICLLCCSFSIRAQEAVKKDSLVGSNTQSATVKIAAKKKDKNTLKSFDTGPYTELNALAPSKAAFLSAVLPGLGQLYNKTYLRAPMVWAAIGTSAYVFKVNDNLYRRYRDAFKSRRAGFMNDEFYDVNESGIVPGSPDLSDSALQDGQERYQKDRDLYLVVTIGLYALNIIDANVQAHLRQFNVNDQLSVTYTPFVERESFSGKPYVGMSMKITY
ncbi:MAG: DUF5683 domain-containing protein [Flavobacteriaceae bacterium]|nr:DUF5683 domain-containing protein [Flavobacteriaceae bacterium]MCI5088862.1 DUF5683 domain-containing protein [Flavobacteriaceae bacterium]